MSNTEQASFQATLADVKFNGKKTVVKLELDNRAAANNIRFLMANIDDEIIVSLGDPQMKMEFEEEPRQGISGTVGPNGVVESVDKPAEDGEQAEMDIEEELESTEQDEVECGNDGPIDEEMDFVDEESDGAA